MLSQKLSCVTGALRNWANRNNGKLELDHSTTDILLTNLQELADQVGKYETTQGPLPLGEPSLRAIERAVACGQVINITDRLTANALRRDLPPDDGGSAA